MYKPFVLAIAATSQIIASDYPRQDTTAPGNDSWTYFYLQNTNIPNIPVRTAPIGSTDWSQDITTCTVPNSWALTYDDGPGLPTPAVLAALRQYNIKATFFVSGSRVVQFPQILRQIYDDGHQVAIHTWAHRALTTLTNDQIIAEIIYTARAINDVIGVMPTYFRPPFGDIDERVRAVIRATGMSNILWNRDTNDAGSMTVNVTFAQWFREPRHPTISLQHDLFPHSAAQIPATLNMTLNSGYRFLTVEQCLGRQDAYRRFPSIPLYVPPVTTSAAKVEPTQSIPSENPSTKVVNGESGIQTALGVFASIIGLFLFQ